MAITLDPQELGFRRPFTLEVAQLLRLGNPTSTPLAFKVKTTAPKQYCVRPNSGRIEAGHEVEVQVLLQAMKEDPPPDARCRDKFLVQSIQITPERDHPSPNAIWSNVEKTAKAEIEEKKIRVSFLPADGTVTTPSHRQVNGVSGDDAPPAYGSGSPSYASPAPQAVTPNTRSVPSDSRPNASAVEATKGDALSSTVGGITPNLANAVPMSKEELETQLSAAKEKIKSLTSQAEEQVLRQRKADAVNQDSRERITTGTTGMGVQQQPADGVPVQIVAALCLLSFLLAYFFF